LEQIRNYQDTALLVMDVQEAVVKMLNFDSTLIDNLAKSIGSARANGIPVIYVVLNFRKGYPEVSQNNTSFWQIKHSAMNLDTEESAKIHPAIAPLSNEIIVIKKRVSAFTGSDLEVVLRSFGTKHLVLTGIATSGVVLSTIREAADKDYELTVLSDCCADRDDEVHNVLMTKVFPRQAEVISAEEWISKNQS